MQRSVQSRARIGGITAELERTEHMVTAGWSLPNSCSVISRERLYRGSASE